MVTDKASGALYEALAHRFGERPAEIPLGLGPASCPPTWRQLAGRGSCRRFADKPVAPELIDTLCALSLCAPTKSDLQQRDIVIVEDKAIRAQIDQWLSAGPLAQDWIPGAPALLVFCGNNRRQRQLHGWRGKPFANDHLDAFFNAAVDAGIALSAFVIAAEAAGLGCTCISAIRNHAAAVSELLKLPDHVFPIAGLGLGWPAAETHVSLRLPLSATVHRDRFNDAGIRDRWTHMITVVPKASPCAGSVPWTSSASPTSTGGPRTRCVVRAAGARRLGRLLREQGFSLD